MLTDRLSNPGPLTYESGTLSIALRGPAQSERSYAFGNYINNITIYGNICGRKLFSIYCQTICLPVKVPTHSLSH